jgi:zinc-binding alcohol dehydrogenase family protein
LTRLVGMGSHTGRTAELDLSVLYRREISLIGCHASNRAEIAEFLPLLADGTLSPVVDSMYPLDAAVEAQARLDSPERFRKVVRPVHRLRGTPVPESTTFTGPSARAAGAHTSWTCGPRPPGITRTTCHRRR